MNDKKVTEKEAKIISEVMEELNKDKPLKKRLCKKKDLEMIFGKSKKKSSKLKKKKKLHL